MKRKILYLILAFLFFLGSVTFYINTVAIPKYLKNIIVNETQEFLGRKIILHDLHFNPIKGFVFNGITIYEEDSPDIFATIANANVQLLYWPLIRERKVVLSNLELGTVSLNLIHYYAGEWNYSDIVERRLRIRRTRSASVYLSRIELKDSRIKVTSLEDGAQFSDVFDDLHVHLGFSVSKGLSFEGSTVISERKSSFVFNGNYQPVSQKLSAGLKLDNFPFNTYYRLFRQKFPFTIESLFADHVAIELLSAKHLFNFQGTAEVSRVSLHTSAMTLESGSLSAQGLKGSFIDGKLTLHGIASAQKLKASFNGTRLNADRLSADIKDWTSQGQSVNGSGTFTASQAQLQIPDQLSLQGDLALNHFQWERGLHVTSIKGSPQLTNIILKTPTISVRGHFTSPELLLTTTRETTAVKGSITADALSYQWPGKELTGRVTFADLRVNGNHGSQWTSQARIQGEGIEIDLGSGKSFQGAISGTGVFQYFCPSRSFQLKSNYQLSAAKLNFTQGLSIDASPTGSVTVSSRTDPLDPIPYSGWLDFKGGSLLGTKIGPVDDLYGIVSFQNNSMETSGLSFEALGMPAKLTGNLNDFMAPQLDARIHLDDFDLSAAHKIIPDVLGKNQITLTGKAQPLDIAYKGPVVSTDGADIRFTAQIKDGTATTIAMQHQLAPINGMILYADKILSWKNLIVGFNDQSYTLTGELTPLPSPVIDTNIEGEALKLHARVNPSADVMRFEKLSGRYKKAFINVSGVSRKTADGKPYLDFSGEADLDLNDLPELFPGMPDGIRNCRLGGKTNIKGRFSGDLSHWQDWQYNLTGASAAFSIGGLNLQNIKFNAVQKDNLLKPLHVWGDFYGGELNLVASLDTAKIELPLDLVIRVLNSDLNKFRVDTPLRKHSVSGILSATAILNGPLADLKLLNGKGGVEIKDGLLWEIDLLKGLGGILLIPEYKDIVFTQAGMNFVLDNGLLSTENIQLVGPTLNLFGKGSLDFTKDLALNLWLSPDFNSEVILKSASFKKSTTAIIIQTERFMSVNVTGTLTKPQYKVNKSPVKILQKTGGVILENVSQFFQNIF